MGQSILYQYYIIVEKFNRIFREMLLKMIVFL